MTVLICVGSCDDDFTVGKEYSSINECDKNYTIKDNYGIKRSVPLSGRLWHFKIKGEKYTAISGDQSLFELLQSPDYHLYVYRAAHNNIFSSSYKLEDMKLLAERKPVEYIPAIGDKFIVKDNDKILTCHFIDVGNTVHSHDDNNVVYFYNPKYSTFTKV